MIFSCVKTGNDLLKFRLSWRSVASQKYVAALNNISLLLMLTVNSSKNIRKNNTLGYSTMYNALLGTTLARHGLLGLICSLFSHPSTSRQKTYFVSWLFCFVGTDWWFGVVDTGLLTIFFMLFKSRVLSKIKRVH